MVAVHSMLEYPLWYAYFLLPTAFAFGLLVERADGQLANRAASERPANVTRPFVLASMLLILAGTLALYDYMRVVVIFAPPANAGPLLTASSTAHTPDRMRPLRIIDTTASPSIGRSPLRRIRAETRQCIATEAQADACGKSVAAALDAGSSDGDQA